MKVSIVTATYNGVETLAYAAESIFSQTYPNIEYIIVDGGFSDGTINLVKSFGQKVDIFISEHDHGIYHAINKGLEVSSGDIVGLLHADDQLAGPEVISKIVQIFRETDCDAVYGDLQYVSRTDGSRIIRYWKSSKFNKGLIHKGWMPPHPTLYIRRELFEKHGPYNSLYQIASDYDFILKLIEDPQLSICYLPDVLVRMRIGGTSNQGIRKIIRKSYEDLLIMRSHKFPNPFFSLLNKNFSKVSQFFKN